MLSLLACDIFSPQPANSPMATSMPTFTPAPQTPTILPTETPATTATPLPLFTLDGLRMAYIIDGNLYVQDSGGQPVQLTNSGLDRSPILSDDGQKIVFYRGDFDNVYSIDADGGQEQTLLNGPLSNIAAGTKVGDFAFVPGTHQLLFNTYLCEPQKELPACAMSIFLADTDTSKVTKTLITGLKGAYWGSPPFQISPDGKMVGIAISGHIDIFDLQGQVVRHSIMTYIPSEPSELFPIQYWLPDSSGLVVLLPNEEHLEAPMLSYRYTAWRYVFEDNMATQIPLDPQPEELGGCGMHVSPDRNWIIYNKDVSGQFFVGDLRDGHTQLYVQYACPIYSPYQDNHSWSPDNKHFVYEKSGRSFLGAIDEPPVSSDGDFLGWVDASHYIFHAATEGPAHILVRAVTNGAITTYESGISLPAQNFVEFTFVILGHKANQ